MVKKISQSNKEKLGGNLEKIIRGAVSSMGRLFNLAVNLEKEGKSEYEEIKEISGRTKSGKKYQGVCGLRVKIGLPAVAQRTKADFNFEEFRKNIK